MPTKSKESIRRRTTKQHRKVRAQVIAGYGGKCVRCGFSDDRALQIDHVNGDGAKQRKLISPRSFLYLLKKLNFPACYQLLCANCNFIKRVENGEVRGAPQEAKV